MTDDDPCVFALTELIGSIGELCHTALTELFGSIGELCHSIDRVDWEYWGALTQH